MMKMIVLMFPCMSHIEPGNKKVMVGVFTLREVKMCTLLLLLRVRKHISIYNLQVNLMLIIVRVASCYEDKEVVFPYSFSKAPSNDQNEVLLNGCGSDEDIVCNDEFKDESRSWHANYF